MENKIVDIEYVKDSRELLLDEENSNNFVMMEFWPDSGKVRIAIHPRNCEDIEAHYRTILQWSFSHCYTSYVYDDLMEEAEPLFKTIMEGYKCVWNGSNDLGTYTDEAEDAICEIDRRVEEINYREISETIEYIDADDYFQVEADTAEDIEKFFQDELNVKEVRSLTEEEEELVMPDIDCECLVFRSGSLDNFVTNLIERYEDLKKK